MVRDGHVETCRIRCRRAHRRIHGPRLDINPSLEVSIVLNSSATLIDFDAMLFRSSASTTDAPDSSAAISRLAACAAQKINIQPA